MYAFRPQHVRRSSPKLRTVIDRNGKEVEVEFDKITRRNQKLAHGMDRINLTKITQAVIAGMGTVGRITVSDIDQLSIDKCENLGHTEDPQYLELASAIAWSDLVKTTPSYREYLEIITDPKQNLTNDSWANFCLKNVDRLEEILSPEAQLEEKDDVYLRDRYTYLAYQMLKQSYLLKVEQTDDSRISMAGGTVESQKKFWTVERPSYMLLRVAVQWFHTFDDADCSLIESAFRVLCTRTMTPATPVLQYSGTKRCNMNSCYLLAVSDSLVSIKKSWDQMASISADGGGMGGDITAIRCNNSVISTTKGITGPITGWCTVWEAIAEQVNQGGKRKGALALYLDSFHPDLIPFVQLKAPDAAANDIRAHALHLALWNSDIFFARLEYQAEHPNETVYWPTFNPQQYPELRTLWGPEFSARFEQLEAEQKYVARFPIRKYWDEIIKMEQQKGEPYQHAKCTINAVSSHINVGAITSSNLCSEIVQYHDENSIAVCTLSSMCLPMFVTRVEDPSLPQGAYMTLDFGLFETTVRQMVRNQNATIDVSYMPRAEAKQNQDWLRAIALGCQGLADLFAYFHIAFDSEQASQINHLVFEMFYFWALSESNKIAIEKGQPYPAWNHVGPNGEVPPLKRGAFHWELKGVQPAKMKSVADSCANSNQPSSYLTPMTYSGDVKIVYTPDPVKERGRRAVRIELPKQDWEGLRQSIMKHGVYNSMLIGLMPTMSTSKIMNWTDSFEPSENMYMSKNASSSSAILIKKQLHQDLDDLELLTSKINEFLHSNDGSISKLPLPEDCEWLRAVHKTPYELSPRVLVDLMVDRQSFIDQSQSFNVFMAQPSMKALTSMYIHAWRRGAKCLSYYIRSKPAGKGKNLLGSSPAKPAAPAGNPIAPLPRGRIARPSPLDSVSSSSSAPIPMPTSSPVEPASSNEFSRKLMRCKEEADASGGECEVCMG